MVISTNIVPGQGDRPAGTSHIRVGTVNVGTMSGRGSEVVEMLMRRNVDVCCAQETRWRGGSARKIEGKDSIYKLFWSGDQSGLGGVGILLAEKWIDAVLSVKRHRHLCMQLRFLVGIVILNLISCYAPQTGLSTEEKHAFCDQVVSIVAAIPDDEMLLLGGDLNGHVGQQSTSFEDGHGGYGYGEQNQDGVRILDFCVSNKLAIVNTFFQKTNNNRLVTYSSGGNQTQIDYILTKRCQLKNIRDVKVIGREECITQHKLLFSDVTLSTTPAKAPLIPPRRKLWKLNDA